MTSRTRIKARISEAAMVDLANDIDSAIERRDLVSLAAFAREAELTAGMDQAAARAREVLSLLESKAATSARDELLRIKAALRPPAPSQADLARAFDVEQLAEMMNRGAPFSVNSFEADEARRVEEANRQLAARQSRHEEQRRAQVAADAEPRGPWR
jgi:hypothetical protein